MANAIAMPRKKAVVAELSDHAKKHYFKDFCKRGHDMSVTRSRYKKTQGTYCTACASLKTMKRRAASPELKQKASTLATNRSRFRTYGVSPVEYAEMLVRQKGVCSICKGEGKRHKYALGVDHNHKTGKVRELLCAHCNAALGMAKESPEILRAMIAYLDKHKEEVSSLT